MKLRSLSFLVSGLGLATAACGGSTASPSSGDAGADAPHTSYVVPSVHRAVATACGDPGTSAVPTSCTSDTECDATSTCTCTSTGNACVPSGCRVDADCGAGTTGYCSPTPRVDCGTIDGIAGWYCHTPKDECTNDADCSDAGFGSGTTYCGHDQETGRWSCMADGICAG